MHILIPMAGAGSRFSDVGYKLHKPAIPVTSYRTRDTVPMVVAATMDLPDNANESTEITYIDRDFHKRDGLESIISGYYPKANFITLDRLTEGQASTCLLAKDLINNEEELLIAGCDNGMIFDHARFSKLRQECDAIIFTFRNHDLVMEKPSGYGWVKVDDSDNVTGLSVKKTISDNPLNDHAIVATFWFKHGVNFVAAAENMIAENDRVNGEFYVDQVMQHAVNLGLKVKVFEVERYVCWGTPKAYEEYEKTINYWRKFIEFEEL